MEPVKTLSIPLESSTEATTHDTLDYFLRLLYEVLETAPKRRLGACTVFNTFVDVFRLGIATLSTLCVWEMRNFPPYLRAHRFVFGFSRALLGNGEWRTLLGTLHRQHSTKASA